MHCRLPLLSRSSVAGGEAFCCNGCWIAHRLAGSGAGGGSSVDGLLARIVLSAFLSMGVMVFSLALYGEGWDGATWENEEAAIALRGIYRLAALALTVPILGLLAVPMIDGWVRTRRWLAPESLALSGVLAAFTLSAWNTFFGDGRGEVYYETVGMVLVLFSLGRWIDSRGRKLTAERLEGSIREAWRERSAAMSPDGRTELAPGDRVRVEPGEIVTFDGIVVRGRSQVDLSILTGEELPRQVGPGERVPTGTVPIDGFLELEVEAVGEERWIERVEASLRRALAERGPIARLNDRVAGWLLPLTAIAAATVFALSWRTNDLETALMSGLAVVLISCPCALGVATPIAFWIGLGEAWKHGVLVRGADVFERLAGAERILFDKTGTLTRGELDLVEIEHLAPTIDDDRALSLAHALEARSSHPVARAIVRAYEHRDAGEGSDMRASAAHELRLLPGTGIEGRIDGVLHRLTRSDEKQGERTSISLSRQDLGGGSLELARFHMEATTRAEAQSVLDELRGKGLELSILSGDAEGATRKLARRLAIPYAAECHPEHKLEALITSGRGTVFVGDGWNDAAALAAADVGIAVMDAAPASIERAHVHLRRPGLEGVALALTLARRAVWIARGNLVWALLYNPLGIALAATGHLSPVVAALMMVSSSLLVVWNAGRVRVRPTEAQTQTPGPLPSPSDRLRPKPLPQTS